MARPPSVWHRKEDDTFYTTIKGRQIKLSTDRKEATRLFHELLAKHEEPAGSAISPAFKKVADLFLDESQRTKKPNTYRLLRYCLQSFADHVGNKRVSELKVHHVTSWIAEHQRASRDGEMTGNKKRRPWNESTACSARTNLLACLNWAVAQGYIESHPLTKLKRGRHRRRERYLTAEERKKIRENVKPDFAEFLLALELTGARPFSELATLTAEMIYSQTGTIPFADHKNAHKEKTRTIYLSPQLSELLKMRIEEHPTGYLFRNRNGNPWTSHDATRRLHHATDLLQIPRATMYALRHSMISDALAKGLSANVVGELVGNSPVVIARNYDHLNKMREAMLAAAARAAG